MILYHSRKDLLLEYFQNILFQFEIDFMLSLSPEVKYKRLKRRFIKITVLYSFVCGWNKFLKLSQNINCKKLRRCSWLSQIQLPKNFPNQMNWVWDITHSVVRVNISTQWQEGVNNWNQHANTHKSFINSLTLNTICKL